MEHRPADRITGGHVIGGPIPVIARPNGHVVQVSGDLDLYTGPALRHLLATLTDDHPGHRIVVDLARVRFLDSSGLGVLIGALKHARGAGGQLSLAGCRGAVLEVLVVTGLDRAFPMFESAEDALAD